VSSFPIVFSIYGGPLDGKTHSIDQEAYFRFGIPSVISLPFEDKLAVHSVDERKKTMKFIALENKK
jgi:hypothetical protein